MMNLCLIDCYLNRGVMCLIWEGAEPPASLVSVYDMVTLRHLQIHNPSLYMASAQRLHTHMSTCPARANARRGAQRKAAFVATASQQKAAHICVRALKRR